MDNLIIQILKVFEDNNLFEEGVELIGSWCFYFYQRNLGAPSFPLRTQDIDFLIPNPFTGDKHKEFLEQLEALGFQRDFNSSGSIYLWNAELKIEFITPEKGRGGQATINVRNLGLNAVPLRFVNILLDKPIRIKDKDINLLVPNPVNYSIHKFIIAGRRKNQEKRMKDLQQAICTYTITNKTYFKKQFKQLPKKWKNAVIEILKDNKTQLPLYDEEIEKILFTLQKLI